jgi:hypothetical protein
MFCFFGGLKGGQPCQARIALMASKSSLLNSWPASKTDLLLTAATPMAFLAIRMVVLLDDVQLHSSFIDFSPAFFVAIHEGIVEPSNEKLDLEVFSHVFLTFFFPSLMLSEKYS